MILERMDPLIRSRDMIVPAYGNPCHTLIALDTSTFPENINLGEQEQVIRRLEETGAVLVQGPPGTGKSHTIANLVGHLLAQDKSILVTSHASKALRVVREKMAERPPCTRFPPGSLAVDPFRRGVTPD